jgi:hypothetical protein
MSRTHNEIGCRACRRGTCWKQLRKAGSAKRAKTSAPANDNYADDYEEYADNVVILPSGESRLDYAYDRYYCDGEGCIVCGGPHENWMSWLRERETYPEPGLRVPVIPKAS